MGFRRETRPAGEPSTYMDLQIIPMELIPLPRNKDLCTHKESLAQQIQHSLPRLMNFMGLKVVDLYRCRAAGPRHRDMKLTTSIMGTSK
jgi:hypothetical protein